MYAPSFKPCKQREREESAAGLLKRFIFFLSPVLSLSVTSSPFSFGWANMGVCGQKHRLGVPPPSDVAAELHAFIPAHCLLSFRGAKTKDPTRLPEFVHTKSTL